MNNLLNFLFVSLCVLGVLPLSENHAEARSCKYGKYTLGSVRGQCRSKAGWCKLKRNRNKQTCRRSTANSSTSNRQCYYGAYTLGSSRGMCRSKRNWNKLPLRLKRRTPAYRNNTSTNRAQAQQNTNSCFYGAYTLGSSKGKCRSKRNWNKLPLRLKRITPAYEAQNNDSTVTPPIPGRKPEQPETPAEEPTQEPSVTTTVTVPDDTEEHDGENATALTAPETRLTTPPIDTLQNPRGVDNDRITQFNSIDKTVGTTYILRESDSKASAEIGRIHSGQTFKVLSCGHSENRCLVKFKNKKGYIPESALEHETRYTTSSVQLRSAASKDSESIGNFAKGKDLKVISCGHPEERCLVTDGEKTGYIPERLLTKTPPATGFAPPMCVGKNRSKKFKRLSDHYKIRKRHPVTGRRNVPHFGTDLAAPRGTPVSSIQHGTVVKASRSTVEIKHSPCLKSRYLHLSGKAKGLRRGAKVNAGQVIGFVGSVGRSTGPHLHLEIHNTCKSVNQIKHLNKCSRGLTRIRRGTPAYNPVCFIPELKSSSFMSQSCSKIINKYSNSGSSSGTRARGVN